MNGPIRGNSEAERHASRVLGLAVEIAMESLKPGDLIHILTHYMCSHYSEGWLSRNISPGDEHKLRQELNKDI